MKKIVLLCSEGMSTCFLVSKMKTEALNQGVDCIINSCCESDLGTFKDNMDVLLLAPQIKFLKEEITTKFKNIPIGVINSLDYGTMDGVKVFNQALELLK